MSNPDPIVTFRQLNKAFNKNHGTVMNKVHDEAQAKSKDSVEAASRMAALGNALKVLEAADAQVKSKVLVSPDHAVASLLQTFLAMRARRARWKRCQLPFSFFLPFLTSSLLTHQPN